MQDSAPLLIAIAGFSIVCAGTLFILLLIVLRVTGRSAMSFMSLLIRNTQKPDPSDEPNYIPRPRPSLRSLVEAEDFETAVAKNVVEQEEFGASAAPSPGTNASPLDSPPTPRLNTAERLGKDSLPRRRSSDYDNDEIFGGLLDNDGDGRPDY